MNKITALHYEKDKTSLINSYYLALIPLILFSIYKNGILLFQADLINFGDIFIPVIIYLESIIVGSILSFITKESYKENILICLICAASISINTNLIIYSILLFVLLFIIKYLKNHTSLTFNNISLTRLFLILSLLASSYSYLNIGEKLNKFNYNLFDIFLGHGVGGIATTSLLILLISFVILSLNKFYKKIISFTSSITFIILSIIYLILSQNYDFLNLIFNGTIYFGFIFVAADIEVSPNTNTGMIIYGLTIGLLTFILSLILNIYEASYISIFIVSLIIPFINQIINKKYLHN